MPPARTPHPAGGNNTSDKVQDPVTQPDVWPMRKKSNHGCQHMGALGNSGLAMPHLQDGLVGGWLMGAVEDLSLPFFWAGIQASFLHLALTDGGRALFGLQGGLHMTSVLAASAQAATDAPLSALGTRARPCRVQSPAYPRGSGQKPTASCIMVNTHTHTQK